MDRRSFALGLLGASTLGLPALAQPLANTTAVVKDQAESILGDGNGTAAPVSDAAVARPTSAGRGLRRAMRATAASTAGV